jgi:membrane protease YdiL (CAAX protease family)
VRNFFSAGVFKHPLFIPLVIYVLFFCPDSVSIGELFTPVAESVPEFSPFEEAFQLLAFYLPAAALVLHFCFQDTPNLIIVSKPPRISCRFLLSALAVLVCTAALLLIGGFTVFVESLFTKTEPFAPAVNLVASPSGPVEISLMAASCIVAAYLEEGFFRALLYGRLLVSGLKKAPAILVASLMFAVCHLWEGLWGVAGAFLSGLFLSLLFERKKSLSLVALGHALYNITVYLLPF